MQKYRKEIFKCTLKKKSLLMSVNGHVMGKTELWLNGSENGKQTVVLICGTSAATAEQKQIR